MLARICFELRPVDSFIKLADCSRKRFVFGSRFLNAALSSNAGEGWVKAMADLDLESFFFFICCVVEEDDDGVRCWVLDKVWLKGDRSKSSSTCAELLVGCVVQDLGEAFDAGDC